MSSAMDERFSARSILLTLAPAAMALAGLLGFAATSRAAEGDAEYAAAAALYNDKAYNEAALAWSEFLKAAPNHPRAADGMYYLGISHFQLKKFDQAAAAFQKLVADHPKFKQAELAWYYLGLSQYSQATTAGDTKAFGAAAATFARLIEQFPQGAYVPQAQYYLAESMYSQGKRAEAVPLYEAVVADQKAGTLRARALYALGVAQEELMRPEQAGEAFQQFLNAYPNDALAVEVGFRLGESLLARDQFAEAEEFFKSAAASKDFKAADLAQLRVAECLAARKRYTEAAQAFRKLIADYPDSAYREKAQLDGGKCAYLAGDDEGAIQALRPLANRQGEVGAEAAHWVARSLLRSGKPAEAHQLAQSAAANADGTAYYTQLLLDQADALYEQPEKRDEAAAAYVALADRHSSDPVAAQARYMAGFALLNQGKLQQAVEQAQAFLKAYPDSELVPDVKYVAAESQLRLKNYDASAALYRELLEKFPNHAESQAWTVRLGRTFSLQGNPQAAIDTLTPVAATIRLPARKAEALYLLGISQSDLGKFAEAAHSLKASLAADANWTEADETLLALAQAQFRLDNVAAARKSVAQMIDTFPNSPALDRAWYLSAEYAYAARDYATAEEQYRQIIRNFSDSPLANRARYGLAWAQQSQGTYSQAIETLNQFLAALPPDAAKTDQEARRAYYLRGLARYNAAQQGSEEQRSAAMASAVDDLQTFLKLAPQAAEQADALYRLGLAQAGSRKPDDAVATYRKLLKEFPAYHEADKVLYELAWTLNDLGKADEAAETFAQLAEKHAASPLAAEARFNVGEAQYSLKDYTAAAKSYYQAERHAQQLAADKTISAAQANTLGEQAAHKLGWSYYRQKDFDKAEKSFAYQLRAYPQGKLAGDARFMQGESLFEQEKYDEALDLLKNVDAVSNPEFQAVAVLHAAQAANLLEKFDDALALLKDYRQNFPEASTRLAATYEEGWALQSQGKLDEAMQRYEQVIEEDGGNNSEVAAKSRFMIGEIFFEKKEHTKAIIEFYKVAKGYGYPQWQANAYYEAARCFEVLKRTEQALANYREVLKYDDSDKRPLAEERIKALGG